MAKYRFVGEGQGVPGLPHVITDEEAKAMGNTAYPHPDAKFDDDNQPSRMLSVHDMLMQAVEVGTYKKVAGKPAEKKE